ncbi:MAG TPA: helix-hairpin-helix domain-containing protein [Terriglobales bacterium]|nr:helix-hairpin-helix domain-containing protein [Terriglobales bacterium]
MMKRYLNLAMLLAILIYLPLFADAQTLPPGKGQEIVQQKCVGCHALKVVTSKRASKEQWSALVDQMVSRGADVPDEDIETVINYLSTNFGANTEPPADARNDEQKKTVNVNKASATELAEVLDLSGKEASAIVTYREQNGAFKEWHDLTNVPGLEPKKIESNKDRLIF